MIKMLLLELADLLDRVDPDKFDMSTWASRRDNSEKCATTACMAGWATTIHPQLELVEDLDGDHGRPRHIITGSTDESAFADAYDLDINTTYKLCHDGIRLPSEKAAQIRFLVKHGSLPPPNAPRVEEDPLWGWFIEFHEANPEIYKAFVAMAYEIRRQGHKRYGAKTIMERLRWETPVQRLRWETPVRHPGSEFKLNNDIKDRCTARYARLLIRDDPSFSTFFALSRLKRAT